MKKSYRLAWFVLILLIIQPVDFVSSAAQQNSPFAPNSGGGVRPPVWPGKGLSIGIEYCLLDQPAITANHARIFGDLGVPGAKNYPEALDWDSMQKGPNAPIDFTKMDGFIREYQKNGMTNLTLCLKPHNRWASVHVGNLLKKNLGGTNASPKPQYMSHYQNWVYQVVERYDGDGQQDMPGLRFPVNDIEIGSELSTYQPEPVAVYIKTLEAAYQAAHRASNHVRVTHAAFLTTPVDLSRAQNPSQYEQVFATTKVHDKTHGLASMRQILDRPDIFDVVDIHPLGDPYEIESIVRWLNYEMSRRGYKKDIISGDTMNTSYIAWGPATECKGKQVGILIPPATEEERCRIAEYFKKLVNGDASTLAWTRGFVAADHVQRTVIAAEQGLKIINLSFVTDLPFLTSRLLKAGAGISAWGGMIKSNAQGAMLEKYPNFYAIQQMGRYINGYDSVERMGLGDERARVYVFTKQGRRFWVAWMNPMGVYLPSDSSKQIQVALHTGTDSVVVEPVVTQMGQSRPQQTRLQTSGGTVNLTLSFTPIYVFAD
jgi:hypothetical protein